MEEFPSSQVLMTGTDIPLWYLGHGKFHGQHRVLVCCGPRQLHHIVLPPDVQWYLAEQLASLAVVALLVANASNAGDLAVERSRMLRLGGPHILIADEALVASACMKRH